MTAERARRRQQAALPTFAGYLRSVVVSEARCPGRSPRLRSCVGKGAASTGVVWAALQRCQTAVRALAALGRELGPPSFLSPSHRLREADAVPPRWASARRDLWIGLGRTTSSPSRLTSNPERPCIESLLEGRRGARSERQTPRTRRDARRLTVEPASRSKDRLCSPWHSSQNALEPGWGVPEKGRVGCGPGECHGLDCGFGFTQL
jgi:hypothetical protein